MDMMHTKHLRDAVDFLMWSYFNLTLDDGENTPRILSVCIRNAYLDATQQGAYNTLIDKNDSDLKESSQKAEIEAGKKLLTQIQELAESKEVTFDNWHKTTCNNIKGDYAKVNGDCERFSYGNAQKWVNMTLKYIYILYWIYQSVSPGCKFCEVCGEIVKKYAEELHVPIDSFIIEAFSLKNDKAWSKWSDSEYQSFRKVHGEKGLDWESSAWLAIAKKRKEKDLQKLEKRYKTEKQF